MVKWLYHVLDTAVDKYTITKTDKETLTHTMLTQTHKETHPHTLSQTTLVETKTNSKIKQNRNIDMNRKRNTKTNLPRNA